MLLKNSVGQKLNIPEERRLFLYFGTDNLDQFTFQSIKVPIPNLQVPSDLESNGSKMVLK